MGRSRVGDTREPKTLILALAACEVPPQRLPKPLAKSAVATPVAHEDRKGRDSQSTKQVQNRWGSIFPYRTCGLGREIVACMFVLVATHFAEGMNIGSIGSACQLRMSIAGISKCHFVMPTK